MTETPEIFPDPDMPTIVPDTGVESPKMVRETNYLKMNNIDKDIHKELRKKDVYETDRHNIYNLIVSPLKSQLQQKEASEATFQVVKLVRYPIG